MTLDELIERNISADSEVSDSRSSDQSTPQVTRTIGRPIKYTMSDNNTMSKSQRIRQYLESNPEKRNKEVAADLASYGVTNADVANVKVQLKKRAEKPTAKAYAPAAKPAAKVAAPAGPVAKKPAAAAEPAAALGDVSVNLEVLDAGVDFIRRCGGPNEAQHILNLIRRIRG